MAKQSKMSSEEIEKYLVACDLAIGFFHGACGPLIDDDEEVQYLIENSPEGLWDKTEYLLISVAHMVLKDLQKPKETSDYSQKHLQQFRDVCQKLGAIRIQINQDRKKTK